jgi:hypothetical protein
MVHLGRSNAQCCHHTHHGLHSESPTVPCAARASSIPMQSHPLLTW